MESEKLQIAVCDDEKEIRDMLREKIMRLYPNANIVLFQSGEELQASDKIPDILLLDIKMPGKDGMEIAREIRRKNNTAVIIFITVLEEYVFQAFDVGAFHYLLKPFSDEKFVRVMKNAVRKFEEAESDDINIKKKLPGIIVNVKGTHITVNPEDIIYAEVLNRKITLHTKDSDIEYYGKMKELTKEVGDGFYRSHRGYLVNFDFIREYDSATIRLEKGQALMAKKNYGDFVKSYMQYNLRKGKCKK